MNTGAIMFPGYVNNDFFFKNVIKLHSEAVAHITFVVLKLMGLNVLLISLYVMVINRWISWRYMMRCVCQVLTFLCRWFPVKPLCNTQTHTTKISSTFRRNPYLHLSQHRSHILRCVRVSLRACSVKYLDVMLIKLHKNYSNWSKISNR